MLKMWKGAVDFVIAETAEEAQQIAMAQHDCTAEEVGEFTARNDADLFVLFEGDPSGDDVTKPTGEWVREHGRGYFACTEW